MKGCEMFTSRARLAGALVLVLAGTVGAIAGAASTTSTTDAAPSKNSVIFFVADGMRQDLVEAFANSGDDNDRDDNNNNRGNDNSRGQGAPEDLDEIINRYLSLNDGPDGNSRGSNGNNRGNDNDNNSGGNSNSNSGMPFMAKLLRDGVRAEG